MKDIERYISDKYNDSNYTKIEDGIYQTKKEGETYYVTSLSFIQEPEFDEGEDASDISQYPLEDILDKFFCHISDFYEEINTEDSKKCYLEFSSVDLEDIENLSGIIGKHVYNKEDGEYVKLIIE